MKAGYVHWMGLHGKSYMPLMLGFGCNVPAVMRTGIMEERRAHLLTMLLTPFVPCTARLAVLAFLASAFFGGAAAWAARGFDRLGLWPGKLLASHQGRCYRRARPLMPQQVPPASTRSTR